jgi:signal transduction histidine kinase
VPVIDSQRRNNRDASVPRGVERNLFLSYFIVFAILLVGFVVAVHLAFVAALSSQMSAHLDTLLSAGVRSVRITGDRIAVKESSSPAETLTSGQGLQWFDANRKPIVSEGMVSGAQLLTRSRPIVSPKTGAIVGWVRASQDLMQMRAEIWSLDEILIIGGIVALAASLVGGRYLQSKSVQPIRASYEQLQEFSADASHELRGPITAVRSNADAALRDSDGMRAKDRERFVSISQGAEQMARLTDDLLLLARADQPLEHELFVVDLSELVDRVLRLYRANFESHGINLRVEMPRGITVYGNPDQIERIFGNLLQNALRYTPNGGVVAIEGAEQRSGVTVRVKDSGAGIHPEHLEKIFNRFWRAEPAHTRSTGTGLGLPIARALARRHGGDVTVSSEAGRGSEFVVTFPTRPPK